MSGPVDAGLGEFDALPDGVGRAVALAALTRAFAGVGPAEGARVSRILFAGVSGIGFMQVIADPAAPVSGEQLELLRAAARRYLAGEPPGRILGQREFWGLNFRLGPDTLEPRPDTETLVETALRRLAETGAGRDAAAQIKGAEYPAGAPPRRILDLGAGSGCILIALLSELPDAFGIGIDLAPGAAAVAMANAVANGVGGRCAFVAGDWADPVGSDVDDDGLFDLVTSNPPYIEDWALAGLSAGVRLYDPMLALDGGRDGLAPYRRLAPEAFRLLKPGGVVAFEVGAGQAAIVAGMLRASGLVDVQVTEDLAGIMRVVSGRR